jgi:hypothetical protein
MKPYIKRNLLFLLILLLLLLLFILYKYDKKYHKENFESNDNDSNSKNAIVLLTRGYDNLNQYNTLIERNKAINDVFYSKLKDPDNYDVIIFNEGNISQNDQNYIQSKTPDMFLKFITVEFYDTNIINDYCPPDKDDFSSGYKNMCYFWSIDFFEYLKDYEYVIRIDEDCILKNLNTDVINNYKQKDIKFSSAFFQGDDDSRYIVGLYELFDTYLKDNNLNKYSTEIKCPYTNFMIVNIPYFRNNKNVQEILNRIKESNCIFSNRWGDLPILGYILTFLIDPIYYYEDKSIKYTHGSHNTDINLNM